MSGRHSYISAAVVLGLTGRSVVKLQKALVGRMLAHLISGSFMYSGEWLSISLDAC